MEELSRRNLFQKLEICATIKVAYFSNLEIFQAVLSGKFPLSLKDFETFSLAKKKEEEGAGSMIQTVMIEIVKKARMMELRNFQKTVRKALEAGGIDLDMQSYLLIM